MKLKHVIEVSRFSFSKWLFFLKIVRNAIRLSCSVSLESLTEKKARTTKPLKLIQNIVEDLSTAHIPSLNNSLEGLTKKAAIN